VLLDFQLPDGDGLEFLNDIHNDINRQDTLSHRSVIMLTGKGNENIAVNAMKLGAKDYLVKGETTALLLKKTINQVLREVALSQSLDQLCQEKYHLEAAIQARTQELAISDRKFRGIFNHSFQLTGMLDLDGNLLEVNQAALAFKGLQLDEVINRPFWETPWWDISQAARDQIRAAIAHIVQPKTDIIHYEVDLLNSDNEIICCDFSLRPLLDESGTMTMIIAEGRDLSLVKQTEADLRIQAQILDQIHDAVISTTLDGTIQTWNSGAEKLYGYKADEAIGKNVSMLYFAEDLPRMGELVFQPLLEQGSHEVELRQRQKLGTEVYVNLRLSLIKDSQGHPIRLIGCSNDVSDRQQAKQELQQLNRELEDRVEQRTAALKEAQKIAHLGSWEFDVLANQLSWSPEIFEFFRLDPDVFELSHQSLEPYFTPASLQICKQIFHLAIEQNEPFETDYQIIRGDGTTGYVFSKGQPITDQTGQVIRILGITMDISDRKTAEQENFLLKERLQFLLASSPAMIYSCKPYGDYGATFMSENIKTILGYEPSEFTSTSGFWADHIHPEDVPGVFADLPQLFNEGTHSHEYRFLHHDGHYVWLRDELRLLRDAQGQPLEIIGYFADITDLKETEIALQESRKFMQTILDTIPISIFWKDRQSNFVGCNLKFAKTLGLDATEMIIGKNDWDLSATEAEAIAYRQDDQEVMAGNRLKLGIIETLTLPSGEQKWLETHKAPLKDWAENVVGVVGMFQDITLRKQTEIQLKQSNEELIRATQLKNEFLANMSHELRTPLNAILGMSEVLQEQIWGELNQKQLKAIATIERSGEHLLSLINDILDLSKVSSGMMELQFTSVSVTNLCSASLSLVRQQALKQKIQLNLDLPNNIGTVNVDERRMKQVLLNLLTNAVKFTPEGGRVRLRVAIAQAGNWQGTAKIPPQLQASQESLILFQVVDTGIGIAAEDLPKLFQSFTQIDSALNRQYKGTGLGLALVKQIVELHGGEVIVSSELGQGSCFTVVLPQREFPSQAVVLDRTADRQRSPEQQQETPAIAPLILLAEDNEANLETMMAYFSTTHYRILVAKDGQEAIAMAKAHRPDLILMDIQMPGVDGLEASRSLRADAATGTIPIIALTALAMPGDREKCLAAGVNTYLSKPIIFQQLNTLIRQTLALDKLESVNRPTIDPPQ
jgi:PAS domain S-box-containing protein